MKVVPELFYDGGEIDVLWDNHDQAINWYLTYMNWEVKRKESWWPDQRVQSGKMTHLGYGTWLNSVLTLQKLPFHYAERGSVDPHIRWCWRAKNIQQVHNHFGENGIRVTDIYFGPDGQQYFDFWATVEGTRLTAEGDDTIKSNGFKPSCTRIGVRDLRVSSKWYQEFVGMSVLEDHTEEGYLVLALKVNHSSDGKSIWILEQLPSDAYIGKIDGPIRPLTLVKDRMDFFAYHQFLRDSGVECGEVGGFLERGRVLFHFYDPDGNRFNVSHC
ncbi:VOC family protein [Paenibacillus sp. GCM10027626]|uniref:VOC family protein n=1 Tax=Paenibacillus sp. GCM10027626 TaxID=3273411 RepID=UPI0036322537